MKTSETDPIRVDYIPAELLGLRGRIGMTFAPGKKGSGVHGQWRRDLGTDLTRIRDVYRTSLVVTLVEPHELALLGIEALFETVRELGLETIHVPIKDGSVPKMDALVELVGKIIAAASEGKNVVVHCRGGLGRAGLVTACCVVACGHPPSEAICVVRRARKGAIENAEQEQVVSKFEVAWQVKHAATQKRAIEPSVSRFVGCLLGGALGDALGYPIEFTKPGAAIVARHGKVAPADLRFAVAATGVVSDDTQMTLFTAEAIVRAANRAADRGICSVESVVARAYLRWHATQTGRVEAEWSDPLTRGWLLVVRELHAQRAPGNTCMSALAATRAKSESFTIDAPPNDSKGCGAVMRSAPFGLAASTREEAFRWGRDAGVLTHGHPSGYLSGAYFAAVIFDVARGATLPDAMGSADELLANQRGHEEMRAIIAEVRRLAPAGPPTVAAIEKLGEAWVGEQALAIGLLCALTAGGATPDTVAAALWRSVAHGGDSDSTGSITGNLLGAMHGVDALPPRWLAQLEMRDVIERCARDRWASSVLGARLDFEAYPPN